MTIGKKELVLTRLPLLSLHLISLPDYMWKRSVTKLPRRYSFFTDVKTRASLYGSCSTYYF